MSQSSGKAGALPPVPLDQILVLVNRYLKSTALFLNDFAAQSDARLKAIAEKRADLEAELALLEAKFGSVELKAETNQTPIVAVAQSNVGRESVALETSDGSDGAGSGASVGPERQAAQSDDGDTPAPTATTQVEEAAAATESDLDVRLKKYRSMLKMGIVREAVVRKMELDDMADLIPNL